jgi:uncharacterized protein (DUF1778 family)
MTAKTPKRRAGAGRPDRRSKKRSGYVNQTLRPDVQQNKLIREAAELEGLSINFWAVRVLVSEARKRIAKEKRNSTPESE